MDFPVYVVLPGSGVGLRFGSPTPKQYTCIMNKPLFLYTVQAFHRFCWVHTVVVVVSPDDIPWVKEQLKKNNLTRVRVVAGADTRHRSIYNGVKALRNVCGGDDIVLIHDIVRVLAEESVVRSVASAARQHGASGITRPLTSTVIAKDSEGFLSESLDRTKYLASEMPQGFHFDIINTAFEKASEYDFEFGTECLHLASKYTGTKVRLVEGPDSLWKVTYRKDLFAAEGVLREDLSSIFIEEGITDQRENIISCVTEGNLKVSSEMSPSCTDSGFVFFVSEQSLESDIASKIENISSLMIKIMSPHNEKYFDFSCNGFISEPTKKEDYDSSPGNDQKEGMVCPKCSFLAKKTIVLLVEINKSCRSSVIESTRDRLLGARLPDDVFMSVVVYHKDSNIQTVRSLSVSLLKNQDSGMNCQVLYVQ